MRALTILIRDKSARIPQALKRLADRGDFETLSRRQVATLCSTGDSHHRAAHAASQAERLWNKGTTRSACLGSISEHAYDQIAQASAALSSSAGQSSALHCSKVSRLAIRRLALRS